jgi:hypothetical protein
MTLETASIRYAGLSIELRADPAVRAAIAAELEPFFGMGPPDGGGGAGRAAEPLLRLDLSPEGGPPEALRRAMVEPGSAVAVDTSLYKHLASTGTRWELRGGGAYAVRIDATGSVFVFDTAERLARLYQDDRELLIRDAVRAVKGLFTPAIERGGGVQIHCSGGVQRDGRAILLMGDMWQGKTTVLLEMLDQFDVGMLSCDTVVVRPDERAASGLFIAGWPSPFSVSHGTLSDHARLHDFFPEERRSVSYGDLWREGKKTVLRSQQVVERFGTRIAPQAEDVAVCLVLRFAPNEPSRVEPVASAEALAGHLRTVYLGSRDPIYHNWHRFIVSSDEEIEANIRRVSGLLFERAETYVVTWAPSIVSLMKTVPTLARAHRALGNLLFR